VKKREKLEKYKGIWKYGNDILISFSPSQVKRYGIPRWYNITKHEGIVSASKASRRREYYTEIINREKRNPFKEEREEILTLNEALEMFFMGRYSKQWENGEWEYNSHPYNLYKVYEKWVKEAIGNKDVTAITKDDIIGIIVRMRAEGVTERSIQNVKAALNPLFNELLDEGKITRNPVLIAFKVVRKEEPKTISEILGGMDLNKTLKGLYNGFLHYEHKSKNELWTVENRAFALITLMCARRQEETAKLLVGDVDISREIIRVRREDNKTGSAWEYAIPKEIIPMLEMLIKGKNETDRLFSRRKLSTYRSGLVTSMIRKIDADIPLNGKNLRKAVASLMEKIGIGVAEIDAYILNHADSGSVKYYIERETEKGKAILKEFWKVLF